MSKTLKVFIASSGELSDERNALKELISSYSDVHVKFEIEMWEDMSMSFTQNGIQKDTINPILKKSDVVILMFYSKVGKFTKEELDIAYEGISNLTKPKYLFFYHTDTNSDNYKIDMTNIDKMSEYMDVLKLVEYCKTKEQITIKFNSLEDLKTKVNKELKKIEKQEYSEDFPENKLTSCILDNDNIQGDIDFKIHSSLPIKDPKFIDREDDIKEIISAIINNKECLVYGINGMGGIGKSAIITEVCYIFKSTWDRKISRDYLNDILTDMPYFKDGFLWIRFEKDIGFEKHIENISKIINYKIDYNNDIESLKYIFEGLFSKKDILIVLDSCEQNTINFKKFYDIFNGSTPLLITSRNKFDFITYKKDLNILDEKSARTLFKQNAPLVNDEAKIDIICKDVGYLPLAIIIVSKMTDKFGLNLTINKLDEKLGQKENILKDGKENFISMEEVFDLSYELLTDEEKNVLSISSIFNYPFKLDMLKEITKTDDITTLYELDKKSLIEKSINEKDEYLYSFHPLIREFAQKKFSQLKKKDTYKKAKEIYFLNLITTKDNYLIKEHIKEILVTINISIDDVMYVNYVLNLKLWLLTHGYWSDCEKLLINAIDKIKNDKFKNSFIGSLGDLYLRQNRIEESIKKFNDALKYFTVNNDIHQYLFCKYNLTNIELFENNLKKCFEISNKLSRESLYFCNTHWYSGFIQIAQEIFDTYKKKDLSNSCSLIVLKSNLKNINNENGMVSFVNCTQLFDYETNKKIIKILEKKYRDFIEFNEYRLSFIDSTLDNKKVINHEMLSELNKIKKIMTRTGNKRLISFIFLIEGKVAFYKKNYELAKNNFKNLINEETIDYWLGRCEIADNNFVDAKKYLLKSNKFYISHQNIFKTANNDIYLGLIESENNIENASKILSKCKKIFERYGFIPNEYYEVIQQIEDKRDDLKIDTFDIKLEEIDFFLENLPKTLKLKDNKEMFLISKGRGFYGKGEQQLLTFDIVENDIEELFENKDYYKKFEDNIYLYDFYIDKECVTNQEFINYCKSANIEIPHYLVNIKDELLNEPIRNKKLTINDARAYAKFYNKELPLPQEWEKAFRGEKGSLYFKDSSNKDLLTSYNMFEITDKYKFDSKEDRYRNSSDGYKLIDTFSNNQASKEFIFRCVKPVFSYEDIKDYN